jgi:glycosyltransferase involved in cell wall biosynthesis
MPKVSVCVQAYNHAPYIAQALDSVLMQETDFDYELIIGEDESSDGTREICIRYAEQHPDRIRLFLRSREDVIYINGRATGRYNFVENFRAARGEYIALLDGDDYWTDPHKLQKQVDLLDAHPDYAMCFHSVRKIDDDGNDLGVIQPPGRKTTYTLQEILVRNFIPSLSVMFRNRDFDALPDWFWRSPIGDWPLHILNALDGDIGYIDEVMGVYRMHAKGFMNRVYSEMASSQFRIQMLSLFRDGLAGQLDMRVLDEAMSETYTLLGRQLANGGDMDGAREAWRQAVQLDGGNTRARAFLLASSFGDKPYGGMKKLKALFSRRSGSTPKAK